MLRTYDSAPRRVYPRADCAQRRVYRARSERCQLFVRGHSIERNQTKACSGSWRSRALELDCWKTGGGEECNRAASSTKTWNFTLALYQIKTKSNENRLRVKAAAYLSLHSSIQVFNSSIQVFKYRQKRRGMYSVRIAPCPSASPIMADDFTTYCTNIYNLCTRQSWHKSPPSIPTPS